MASFEEKEITKDQWVLVVSNVAAGNIAKINNNPIYHYKGVPNGGDAPSGSVRGVPFTAKSLKISSETGAIDVYIKASNEDGLVEVML